MKKLEINLFEEEVKTLGEYPNMCHIPDKDEAMEQGINHIIQAYALFSKVGAKQIQGKLADNEWNLIYDVFNTTMIDYRMSQKLLLQAQIEDGCYYEGVDVKWDVDKKALLHKVNELDELSAHAVIIKAFQWWANPNRNFEGEIN